MVERLEPRRMLSVAPAVPGSLNGKVVFAHGGHGYVWRGGTTWGVMRAYVNGMMEDHGNVDQLNFFAEHLLAAGATVVPLRPVGHQLNEVIVDNAGSGFSIQSGTWSSSTSGPYWSNNNGHDAASYRFATTATSETAVARFTPNLPQTGFYPVYAWANPGAVDNRVGDQIYRINYSGGSKEVKVATRLVGNGWIYLGNYYFEAGASGNVEVSNKSATAGKVVIADAIRFGNGMGDYDPDGAGSAPISGQPREEECALYWAYQSRGWTAPGVRIDDDEIDSGSTTLSHEQINFTAPAKWSEYMNNAAFGSARDRLYLSFHSDASSNLDARGTTALITGDNTPNQVRLAQIAGSTIETEMRALDSTHEYPWGSRTDTLTGGYGEIGNGNLGGEMDATIIEVAFHTNAVDAALMKDPRVRNDVGRSTTHVAIKYFDEFDPAFTNTTYAPEPPRNVRATTNLSGEVMLAWQAPQSSAGTAGPYGNAASGYRIWTSTNGYGFDLAATVGNVTSHVFSGLPTSAVTYFMVTAINAGGESLKSWTVAAKPQVGRRAPILIVNNYSRLDRQGDDIETEYFGSIPRVRLRHNNTFDYAVQAAEAIESYNGALGIEMASDDAIANGQIVLSNYHTVIWMSGEQSTVDETFSAAVQPIVSSFLNNSGGKLFVSGSEIGWDLVGQSGETAADSAFYTGTLRSAYVSDDAGTYTTQSGLAGSALAGVPALSFDNGTHGTYDVDFPDVIAAAAASGATVAMNYSTGGGAVVQWAAQTHAAKLIHMGFPFESIYSASQRNALMAGILNYFGTTSTLTTATPSGVDLLASSDTGSSSTDNRTNLNNAPGRTLEFQVSGTVPGATVALYRDAASDVLLGSAVASGETTIITTNGTATLADGEHAIYARQTYPGLPQSAQSMPSLFVRIDTIPPGASLGSGGAQTPSAGAATFDFTVTYNDLNSGVDATTLGNDDITVIGPNDATYAATLLSPGVPGSGGNRIATYRINAPGGTWDGDDAGVYTVDQNANGVADLAGNARPAGAIGTFSFAPPFAYLVGDDLHVEFADAQRVIDLVASGGTLDVARGGAHLSFAFDQFDSIVLHGTTGDDTLNFTGPIAEPVMFGGGAGNDQLNVLGGTFTFVTDAAAACDNLGVDVAAGASVTFHATQHLRDLDVAGAATLTPGGAKVLVTRGLAVAGTLNLGDNDLVLDYAAGAPSPFAAIEGRIRAGYNEGSWDGAGIVTNQSATLSGLTTLAIGEAAGVFRLDGAATVEFSGETVDATSVIVKYTYGGDSNFDGRLNADDYGSIDFNILVRGASGYWNGDFNYDGVINADDYGSIDFNILAQGGPL